MAQISARGSKGHHTFYLSVVESGTNIDNNTSTVTINFWLVDDNNWYFDTWGSNLTYTVTVNGTTYSGNIPDHDTKTTYIITNQTQTITHNNDGTKQISFSFSTTDSTGAYYTPGTASASGTLDLTTLPRASTVTVNNQTIASASGNVSFSITSKADFYHKYRYTINGTTSSWMTAGRVNTTTASFNIAYSTILSAMNNTNLSTLTVEVQTYNSSAYSTLVGTKSGSGNITVTLKPSAPTLTTLGFRSRSSGVNSNITTPTAGYTTVALTAWSHGTSSGASSYTTYFSVDQNASLQTTSATANNTVIETNTLPANAKQYTLTYTAYTVDSRGNRSADATKDVTVYGYTSPLLTLTAYRTATDGSSDTTEDGAGLFSYVTFSNAMRGQADANGNLRSGNQNAIVSAVCKYGSTTVTSGSHLALPETDTRTFVYTVQDRFTTTSTSVTVSQARFPLDLYDDGHGNVGVGFGAIAEGGLVKTPLTIQHRNHYVQKPISADGTAYFLTLCTITITGGYVNTPIYMRVDGRGDSGFDAPADLSLRFANVNTTDPDVDVFFASRNVDSRFYIYKVETSVWKVCVRCNYWDRPVLIDFQTTYSAEAKTSIDFTQDYVTELPEGAIVATQWLWPRSSTANNATYANWTETNPSSLTNYYLPFGAGYSTNNSNRGLLSNNGIWYRTRQGTASALGYSILNLGNATASGTAGNKRGQLRIYADDATYTDICSQVGGGGSVAYLPKIATDSYLQCSKSIWTGSLTGTNSINLDISPYKRIRIYALYATNRQMIWEVDVTKLHATEQYRCNHCEISWIDNAWYHTIFETFISKAKFTLSNVHNMNMSGSTTAMNNNTAYKIYQIDGII